MRCTVSERSGPHGCGKKRSHYVILLTMVLNVSLFGLVLTPVLSVPCEIRPVKLEHTFHH
jgi:hypothetical protein